MKKWLLIHCKSRQETVVVRNLENQGFTTYSPFINVRKTELGVRDRRRSEPLFPGYVFIHVDPVVQSISPVRSTRGVLRFVRYGNQYACASESLIDQIRRNVAEQLERQGRKFPLRKGDVVRINGHGFKDVKAIFSCRRGNDRALVLLQILGRESKATVPVGLISRASNYN